MAKRVAITTIRMKVDGKTKQIKAGTLLNLDGAELADLENMGAVAKVGSNAAARFGYGPNSNRVVRAGPPNPLADEALSAPAAEDEGYPEPSEPIPGMNLKELGAYMKEAGIEKPENWSDLDADGKKKFVDVLVNGESERRVAVENADEGEEGEDGSEAGDGEDPI